MSEMAELFGEPIFSYTRADALDDGVLIDITTVAKEAGFKCPVAITSEAHARYVKVPTEFKGIQDESGRLWDICWMLICAIQYNGMDPVNPMFQFISMLPADNRLHENEKMDAEYDDEHREVTLKALCHGGDEGEMVITIMLPWED